MASLEYLEDLVIRSTAKFKTKGFVVMSESPLIAFGDLHGDVETLEKGLEYLEKRALFLGDYVDRGERGLDVLSKVLELFLEDKAIVLRGNHESPLMNLDGGFLDELCNKFPKCGQLYRKIEEMFSSMTLAAVIDGKILAIHGGIPLMEPDMRPASIEELRNPRGDLITPEDPIAFQALWNDPCNCEDYMPSPRGFGIWLFGNKKTQEFLRVHNLSNILRGHMYTRDGCIKHHKSIYTIFSSRAGPYKGTRPKIALLRKGEVAIIDLYTGREVVCDEHTRY